jgi:hypothetical protein
MEKKQLLTVITRLFFYSAVIAGMLLPSCKSDELKDQIMTLTQQQVLLSNEKDSLFKLLESKKVEYDTLTANLNSLGESNKELLQKIKSLQAGYNARGAQIKKAEAEKVDLNKVIAVQTLKNDSLNNEIAVRDKRIAELNNTIASKETEKENLADVIKQKELRIAADSAAEVKRLRQPKEHGFIDIVGVGGGIGISRTDVLYSERVIGFSNVIGYQINKNFLTGVGFGLNLYDGGLGIPLYLDFRYSLKPKPSGLTPFISADGGLQLYPDHFSTSNIFIQPAIGLQKKLGPKTSLKISFGSLTLGMTPPGGRSTFLTIKGAISFSGKKGPEI